MKPLKALLIEDSKDDAALLLRHLSKEGYDVQSELVQTAADMKAALAAREWDIILSDYIMPNFTGLDALAVLKESGFDIPIIIISGTIGEEIAVKAMQFGVNDYLMKGNLTRLAPAIEGERENAAKRHKQKQLGEDLRRSEASLANAQRLAHIGNWDWDIQNNQLVWSEEVYRIFGLTKSRFGGTYEDFIERVHPDDRQMVQSALDVALSHIAPYDIEHRVVRSNGEERYVYEIGEVIFDESGNPLHLIGTVQDITERKRAAEDLENAAKRERAMIENSLDVICTVNARGKFVSVSPASLKVWGYSPEELIGKPYIEFIAPDDVAKTTAAALKVMSGIEARNFENRYRHKNGSLVNVVWTAFWSKKDSLLFCVAHDITERKAAETEMRLMKSAIDSIVEGIVITDAQKPDNPIIYTNSALEKLSGYAFEEIVGKNCRFMQGAETNQRTVDEIREAIKQKTSFRGEILNYRKNGESYWNELSISPIFDESGNLTNFVGAQQDISERKQAEEILRTSEAKIRQLVDSNIIGITTTKLDGSVVEANDVFLKTVGYSRQDLLAGKLRWDEMTPPEIFRQDERAREQLFKLGYSIPREKEYIRKDGSRVPVMVGGTLLEGSEDTVLAFVLDISERKLAEDALQESEIRLRTILATEPECVKLLGLKGELLEMNPAGLAMLEADSLEQIQNLEVINVVAPEHRQAFAKLTKNVLAGGTETLAFEIIGLKGTRRWLETHAVPMSNQAGKITSLLGVTRDITERRRAEDLIIESEEKYRSIVETANEGIWLTDLETRATYVNRQMAEMLGYTVEEMMGRPIFDFIFEDDLPSAKHKYEQRLNGKSETGEFRMRRKDGSGIITLYNTTPIRNKDGEIVGFLTMRSDITESKKAERKLIDAEAKYRTLVESSPAIVYLAEPHPPFSPIYVSPSVVNFGYPIEDWFTQPDMWVSLIHGDDRERVLRATQDAIERELETDLEYRIVSREGAVIWLHDKGRFVLDEQGSKTGWQGVMVDITKNKELEEQLRQSQKLESVGLLAGGIAHDFNNMLTAINGYSDLTMRKMSEDDPLRQNIEEIKKAGERSADLTHQLLAFSRQQILQPIVLDLNEIIRDTMKLLDRLIGEDIRLTTTLNPNIGQVKADPGQLSQIIMNLAVNARDAMPQGGRLTIETANVFLDPKYARGHIGVLPGAYVMVAVSDTGIGMSGQTKERIFEPFFTTKEIGQGTGLGLAMVYGIVKQSGGSIEVDSEESVGTTFKIYLPRAASLEAEPENGDISFDLPKGTETILLVEDEELVRNLTRTVLEECGYTVLEAQNGLEALEMCERGDYKFDLLMTDVVMPEMGGRELADLLKEKVPELQVLFTSGYTDDAVVRHGVIEPGTNFIQKPFTPDLLAKKIRELMDASGKSVR